MSTVISIATGRARRRALAKRDKLVEEHLYLVGPIARRYLRRVPPSIELDDLLAAGRIGLIQAANMYRPKEHNDTPFTAYARIKIRSHVWMAIRRRNWTAATAPGLEEAPEPAVSGDAAIVESIDRGRRAAIVRQAVDRLPERHRAVVEMHDLRGMKLADVGRELGLGCSRTSQLHVEAIAMLRSNAGLRRDAA